MNIGQKPALGNCYLNDNKVFIVTHISSGTDEISLKDFATGKIYLERYALLPHIYQQVWKVAEVAKLLQRSTRSIYRYEARGVTRKPFCYPDRAQRMVRFYTAQDILEARDLISQVPQGRPRNDKRTVNNTIIDAGNLRIQMRERFKKL